MVRKLKEGEVIIEFFGVLICELNDVVCLVYFKVMFVIFISLDEWCCWLIVDMNEVFKF